MSESFSNIKQLCAAYKKGQRLKYIFFWGHTEPQEGVVSKACLSQWYPASFIVDDVTYQSAEHFMMAGKAALFHDEEIRQQILLSKNAGQAKALGKKVRGFQQAEWEEHCSQIVIAGNVAKFSQNASLCEYLCSTNTRVLVEASPVDKIWGIGLAQDAQNIENPLTWRGLNLLGFALMAAREQLKASHKL